MSGEVAMENASAGFKRVVLSADEAHVILEVEFIEENGPVVRKIVLTRAQWQYLNAEVNRG